jgi:hypothetical protein
MAWQRISPEVTVQGFKSVICPLQRMGLRMICMLWNCSEEGRDVRSECEEDDGTYCEDGASDTDC